MVQVLEKMILCVVVCSASDGEGDVCCSLWCKCSMLCCVVVCGASVGEGGVML